MDAVTFPLFALWITGRSFRLRADVEVDTRLAGGGAVDAVVDEEGKEAAVLIGVVER